MRIKYDKALLEEICERDSCIVDYNTIEKYNRNIKIDFICSCGNYGSKILRLIYENGGGYCKECTIINKFNKYKKTNLEKYGVEHSLQFQEFKDKSKKTNLEKYGVEHSLQFQVFKDKMKQTCLNRYGVEHNSQNAEICEKQSKNSYKLKEFTFPCGKTVKIQGYEPFLLKILVDLNYTFNDIITKKTDVPEIWYEKNDKKHRYYCDAYIKETNTIYEVKSIWTYKKDIEDIPLKRQACIDKGFLFELFVFDRKGIKQTI